MRKERQLLICLGLVALAGCAGVEKDPEFPTSPPTVTVEELAHHLRSKGFTWGFLGRKMTFTAQVTVPGATPLVWIVEKGESIGSAYLYNLPTNELEAGDMLEVHGMLVDQAYLVWRIWTYRTEEADAEQVHAADGTSRPR